MTDKMYDSAIILSIFKRKGGEGFYTNIVKNGDYSILTHPELFDCLEKDEELLIVFCENKSNWLFLTNRRVVSFQRGDFISLCYSDIANVEINLLKEFENSNLRKDAFANLKVYDNKDNIYNLIFEVGKPFQGFYQVLHFIVTKNMSDRA